MQSTRGSDVFIGRPWAKPHKPPGVILRENIEVSSIGHAFGEVPELPPDGPPTYFVHDFLVDQSQSTGGGSALADPIKFDLTTGTAYQYHLSLRQHKHVNVNLPLSVMNAYFSAWLGRQETSGSGGGFFSQTSAQVIFHRLVGTAPRLTYNSFFVTQSNNSALLFEIEGQMTSSFQFHGINLRGDYLPRSFDPGVKSYDPLSYAVPLGTKSIYPKSEVFVLFGYHTTDSVDPGPFVTLA